MALLRTEMCEKDWIKQFIPLKYDIKKVSDDAIDRRHTTNILQAIETNPDRNTVLLYGDGGTGKSTTLNYLCTRWNNRLGLSDKFAHAYLMPIRNIVSPYASLEHIICQDLNLIPREKEQDVRRFIKFNSSVIVWFLDGYDERLEHGKKESTISKLISGKISVDSKVFVTSRPHSYDVLTSIVKPTSSEIYIRGFDEVGVKKYLKNLPKDWAPTFHSLVEGGIPDELLRSPLILCMVCYMHNIHYERSHKGTSGDLHLISTSSILDAVCGIFLGIMEEKMMGFQLPLYTSYRDERISAKLKMMIKSITRLAFYAISSNTFNFTSDELTKFSILENDTENIGILTFENNKLSFLHPLFQEHAAAYHMSDNEEALQSVLSLIRKPGLMSNKLGVFSNTLLFTVGLNPSVLTLITKYDQQLSMVKIHEDNDELSRHNNLDLEFSYQACLFHECKDPKTQTGYLYKLMSSTPPENPVTLLHQPQIEASAYISLVDALGLDRCIRLLKKTHNNDLLEDEDKLFLKSSQTNRLRIITDTVLLSCLHIIEMTDTDCLIIQYGSLKVLKHTARNWKVGLIIFSIIHYTIYLLYTLPHC